MLTGKSILVIDDAEAERTLISTYLQQHGSRVYQAHDGIDGFHKARLRVPDLILMDLDMPRCDGYTACKMLRDDPLVGDVPVIFLSAFADPNQRVQGLLAGAVDFIAKPFDFDEVRLRVALHLSRRPEPKREPANEHPPDDRDSETTHLHKLLFHGARVHLLNDLAEPPGLQELAERVGTNTKRLNQAFRHCADMTVFEYLREQRMNEARQLLSQTNQSITDIAGSVGFTSSANFATAFKERFGTTPSRLRASNNQGVSG